VPSPAYDLNKARALLKEAGYKGEEIEMLGSMGGTQEVEIATVQAQLKKIGMNIKIRMAERGPMCKCAARVNTRSSSPAIPA